MQHSLVFKVILVMKIGGNTNGNLTEHDLRVLVSEGATGAAAPINFWQQVHAPANFRA